ncbi:BTB and MATH domain-containing protein 38-like [Littorina saxatilis]|uniref:BTB and MATH domain-containing protein 38-like n=1 Tax=Littorina saxatilis TaxID=31220 RepID=UPI0038B4BA69
MSAVGSSSSMGNVKVETESEIPSSSRRFPVDSENPFESSFNGSDVVLVVEGKKLYVDKKTLSLHSPVFEAMFDGHFREKDAEEIEIKDTKYNAMVRFLRQMYPVKSFQIDDEFLADILPLADFYQVDHFRSKCEDYIGQQIQRPVTITAASKMFLLLMCDRFSLKHLNALLVLTSKLSIRQIKTNHFEPLQSNTKVNLLERRCMCAEEESAAKDKQMNNARTAFTKDFVWANICACKNCAAKLDKKPGLCRDCVTKFLDEHLLCV